MPDLCHACLKGILTMKDIKGRIFTTFVDGKKITKPLRTSLLAMCCNHCDEIMLMGSDAKKIDEDLMRTT